MAQGVSGGWSTRLGVAGILLFVLGPTLARLGLAPPMGGFITFDVGALLGLIALITGIIGALRGRGVGLGLGLGFVTTAVLLFLVLSGGNVPRINDITTDTAVPPQFVHAGTLEGNIGRDMSYPGPTFADQQKAGYPDLAPLRLAMSADEAFQKVEAAARSLPHTEITRVDKERHALEGIATSQLFRFKDDFVVEVRAQDGGSVVQMRSKSRNGKGDLGANAARIKTLFAGLTKN